MSELPDLLDLAVTRGGEPFVGAWVEMCLPMERKHDYVLMVGPADATGTIALTRADLENQISVLQLSAFMDYSSLGVWRGELILSPFDAAAIRRAEARVRAWSPELTKAYPPDFMNQMRALAEQLAAAPGQPVEISAHVRGGSAHVTCRPAPAP